MTVAGRDILAFLLRSRGDPTFGGGLRPVRGAPERPDASPLIDVLSASPLTAPSARRAFLKAQ
jgi:hypothetical protein